MPMTGLEPVRTRRQILSLLCLPIPPHGHVSQGVISELNRIAIFFAEKSFIPKLCCGNAFLNLTYILYQIFLRFSSETFSFSFIGRTLNEGTKAPPARNEI